MALRVEGGDYEQVLGLVDGTSLSPEFTYQRTPLSELSKRVLSGGEFDAAEYSLANHIMLHSRGECSNVAIPVFPSRAFRNAAVFVRLDSPLSNVSQLNGKRIGISEFAMTTAVWTRGQLQDRFGFDWRAVEWVTPAAQRFSLPDGIRATQAQSDLEAMLCDGKLDALMAGRPKDQQRPLAQQRLRTLQSDPQAEESEYFATTGMFPIMHTVVLHPRAMAVSGAAKQLFDAYTHAKKAALSRRLGAGFLPGVERVWDQCRAEDFESVRYGLTSRNRQIIATLSRYLYEQGLIELQPELESLFVAGSAGWADE